MDLKQKRGVKTYLYIVSHKLNHEMIVAMTVALDRHCHRK